MKIEKEVFLINGPEMVFLLFLYLDKLPFFLERGILTNGFSFSNAQNYTTLFLLWFNALSSQFEYFFYSLNGKN